MHVVPTGFERRFDVPQKVVSERLGYATVAITLDTYSHVLPGLQRGAVDRLDTALRAVLSEKGYEATE